MQHIEDQLHLLHCQDLPTPELLSNEQRKSYLNKMPGWNYSDNDKFISARFSFNDYHQTIEFINKIATIVHRENHHPQIEFGYNSWNVKFTTHSADRVTLFDFICAAHIERL